MSGPRARINKLAFINTIVQTEVHNRMQEEQEMWKKHKKSKRKKRKREKSPSPDMVKKHKRKRKHKDIESNKKKSTDVRISLMNNTVSPVEKWGHDGFVEMHPEEVISGSCFDISNNKALSDTSSSSEEERPKKKRKKKHSKHKKRKKS